MMDESMAMAITSRKEKGWEWQDRSALARLSSVGEILDDDDDHAPRNDSADWLRSPAVSTKSAVVLRGHVDGEQSSATVPPLFLLPLPLSGGQLP
jgi:hypothetical protein